MCTLQHHGLGIFWYKNQLATAFTRMLHFRASYTLVHQNYLVFRHIYNYANITVLVCHHMCIIFVNIQHGLKSTHKQFSTQWPNCDKMTGSICKQKRNIKMYTPCCSIWLLTFYQLIARSCWQSIFMQKHLSAMLHYIRKIYQMIHSIVSQISRTTRQNPTKHIITSRLEPEKVHENNANQRYKILLQNAYKIQVHSITQMTLENVKEGQNTNNRQWSS